jgi:hypothetical protein
MKRLIVAVTAILFSTLTMWAQTGASTSMPATPRQTESTGTHQQHHNKQHNKQHTQHPHHHSSISARR